MSKLSRPALKAYINGFILSVVLTLLAFSLVGQHINSESTTFSSGILIATLAGLAIAQLLVQVVFFLHLGKESKPRWNLMMFLSMIMVAVILIFGTLWIMDNLDYHHGNHVTGEQTEQYIIEKEGIGPDHH